MSGAVVFKSVSGINCDMGQKPSPVRALEPHIAFYTDVLPADNKWVTRAVVADVITTVIRSLDLRFPEVTEEQRKMLAEARNRLQEE